MSWSSLQPISSHWPRRDVAAADDDDDEEEEEEGRCMEDDDVLSPSCPGKHCRQRLG